MVRRRDQARDKNTGRFIKKTSALESVSLLSSPAETAILSISTAPTSPVSPLTVTTIHNTKNFIPTTLPTVLFSPQSSLADGIPMDSPMQRIDMRALSPDALGEGDLKIIQKWISEVLVSVDQDGCFGTVIGIGCFDSLMVVPTILFGIPSLNDLQVSLSPPVQVAMMIREDRITPAVWNNAWKDLKHHHSLMIGESSVGERGDQEAGSIGGFFAWSAGEPPQEKFLGITCSHCLPQSTKGSIVVSPSTLEVTGKLSRIKRYSKFDPDGVGFTKAYDNQTKELLDQYCITPSPDGENVILDGQIKKVLLSGPQAGVVVGSSFRSENTLNKYNISLATAGFPCYAIPENYRISRIDWLLFQLESDRIGPNNLVWDGVSRPIVGIDYLLPGDTVVKFGRTTGYTAGKAHGVIVQIWEDGQEYQEIGISSGGVFADKGDSGSTLLVERSIDLYAAGLVTGKNVLNEIVITTPLKVILEDMKLLLDVEIAWMRN